MTLLIISTVILAAAVVVLWVERTRALRLCAAIEQDRDIALRGVEIMRDDRNGALDRAAGAEAEVRRMRATRREAGVKAARTRKAREQAVQTVAAITGDGVGGGAA